jgi:hypothetical protein
MIKIVEMGTWSWQGGKVRPCYVVTVRGRVWSAYCYRAVAEAAAARLTGREQMGNAPLLADYTPPVA